MQMQKALDDLLCRRYPALYAERNDDPQSTAMCWGFEAGDGWFGIIDALSEVLAAQAYSAGDSCPVAKQVKQKLGSLRFHINAQDKYRGARDLAEEMSRRVCEVSGSPGRLCHIDELELATLAPGIKLFRNGASREVELIPAGDDPITGKMDVPPLAFSLDDMLRWRGDVLAGPVDIPNGWYDLTDAVLHVVQRGGDWSKSARICGIRRDKTGLRLDWTENRKALHVLSETASALSRRIDPSSGEMDSDTIA